MDEKKQGKRRSVSAARLYWAIMEACERYDLEVSEVGLPTVYSLLEALKDDNMEASR